MKQAIAGVAPPELGEVTMMTVWPSIASLPIGRTIGSLCMIRFGLGNVLTVGNLIALAVIPVAIPLYFYCKLFAGVYRLTNLRVIIEKWPSGRENRSIGLHEFDEIEVKVLPGQEWYPAGELIFRLGAIETLRLSGVPRPETFRRTCLKAQRSFVGVERVLEQQLA